MSALGSLVVKLALEYAEYTKGLDKSSQDALKFAQNTQKHFDKANAVTHEFFTGVVKGAASAAVAYLGVSSAVSAFNDSIDNLASLDDMSQKTGATVENLSRLQKVAVMTGTEFGNVDSSITKLAKNMAGIDDESNKTFKALEALGVSSVDAAGKLRDPAEVMIDVAKGLQKYEDGAGKVAIANDLFGKSGAELLPYLNDVNDSVDDFVGVSTEAARQASEMQDRFGALKVQADELKTEFSMALLPAFNDVTGAIIGTYKESGKLEAAWVALGGLGAFLFTDEFDTDKQKLAELNEKLNDLVIDQKLREESFGLDGSLKRLLFGGYSFEELPKAIAYTRYEIEQLQAKIKNDATPQPSAKPTVSLGATREEEERATRLKREQESQIKQRTKFVEGLEKEAATLSMTAAEAKNYEAAQLGITGKQLEKVKALTKSIETHKANEKAVLDDFKASQEYAAQNLEFANSLDRSVDALKSQVEAQRDYNDRIGLSQVAIRDLNSAEVERQAVAKEGMASLMDQIDWTGKLGDRYREEARLLRELNSLKNEGANKQEGLDQINRSLREQSDSWASIDRTAHDTFISIANGGKDTATRLRDTFKNMFFDWLYQMTIKKWVVNVSAGLLGMGAMGAANASPMTGDGVGGLGSISNMVTAGKSLWEGFTAAGTLGNGFWGSMAGGLNGAGVGSGLTSSLGLNMGNYLQGALGNNVAGSLSSGISSISAAMPYAAAAIAAFQISKSINGGYRLGGLSADAGALLGFAPRLFGMQDKQMGGQTVTGALGTQDLMRNQAWSQKGGLFRSDRAGTWSYGLKDSTAIQDGKAYVDSASLDSDKALLNGLNAGYAAIKSASTEFANALGLNAESIAQRTDQLNLTLGKTQEETNAAIQKTFAGIADSIALQLLPGVRELSKENENAAATLARVANQFVVINHTFDDLGLKLFEMSDAGIKASDKFAMAIGGLDALKSVTATYYENFFTQEERSAALVKSLSAEFEKQNLVLPNSREGYRALVEEVSKLGTPEQLASLLKLNEAFASVVPATERLVAGAALVSSSADKAASILQERQSLQDRLDQLTMTSSQLLRKQRDALDESNQALFDQVQAAMSTKAAQEAQTLAAQTNADALASINASYQQQIDALIKASLPLAEQRALESRGMDDSTLTLFNRRNALEDEAAASKEATAAAQQLTSTLKASASDSLAALGKSVATEKLGAKSSLDAKIAIINAQKSAAAASFQWSKMAGEASIKTVTEANQKISALAGSLKSTLEGMRLSATQASDRIAAQAQISQALTLAKSTGILPDVNFLSDALKTVSQPNESLFSSYTEFARDFYVTAGQIADLNAITGDALSKSDAMVEMAKAQLASIEQAAAASAAGFDEQIKKAQEEYDLQISQFDQVMTNAQAQLEAALGTNVAILSMADALRGFQSSLGAMMSAKTTHPAAGSVTNTSSQKTGAAASLDSFKASLRSQPNYSAAIDAGGGYQFAYDAWANGSHANGLDFVPFDGYRAELHQGEMVLPAHVAQSVRGAPAGGGNSDLTRELLEEMRQMKNEIILLKQAAIKTSDNTKQAADILDSVTEGGAQMRSELV